MCNCKPSRCFLAIASIIMGVIVGWLFSAAHLTFIATALYASIVLAILAIIILVIIAIVACKRTSCADFGNCLKCYGKALVISSIATITVALAALATTLGIASIVDIILVGIWGAAFAAMMLILTAFLLCIVKES